MATDWKPILTSIMPFLVLLALWFFLLRQLQNRRKTPKENQFGPPQDIGTTEVAAELRALRQSVDSLRAEIKALEERMGR